MKSAAVFCALMAGCSAILGAPVTALAFSPEGLTLAGSGHRQVLLLSPDDGTERGSLPCDLPRISSLAFSPDGRFLAVAGGVPGTSGTIMVLSWNEKSVLAQSTEFADLATSVAFSPDGSLLAVASADHTACAFRIQNGAPALAQAFSLSGHSGPILAIAFSPNGQAIATGSADRSVKIWSGADGTLIRSFGHHTEIVHALAFRPFVDAPVGMPAQCASGSGDRTIRIWQPEIGRMVRIIRGHDSAIFALAYTPDGAGLFSAGEEGIVRRLDPDSDQILRQWKAHDDWIYSLAVSPNGRLLATGDWTGRVKVWKAP